MKNCSVVACLSGLLAVAVFSSCEDRIEKKAAPEILYPSEELYIDMNASAFPAVICVVNSETGLKSVDLFIVKSGISGERLEEPYSEPVTVFYNRHSYSITETPEYTENMLFFKIVATDLAGQQTVSELPLNIRPPYALPEVYFSTDEAGLNIIPPDEAFIYIEESDMPDLYAQVSGEEDLNYLVFQRVKGNRRRIINDTIHFPAGIKQAAVSAREWPGGDTWNFEADDTGLNVRISAGPLDKRKDVLLPVQYLSWGTFTANESDDDFNGLTTGAEAVVSGSVASQTDIQSLAYTLYRRDGNILQSATPIAFSGKSFDFEVRFTATNDLGKIAVTMVDVRGKSKEAAFDCHVGYRYCYVLAGNASPGSAAVSVSPGPIISAKHGKSYAFCTAKELSADMDGGFSSWNSPGRTLRFTNLKNQKLYIPGTADKCFVDTWDSQPEYVVGQSTVTPADFDKTTVSELKSMAITPPSNANGFEMVDYMTSADRAPATIAVAIYETKIDGISKRVLLTVDKMEVHSSASPAKSTFWVKMKVEL
jgi:hypothetical protein